MSRAATCRLFGTLWLPLAEREGYVRERNDRHAFHS